MFYKKSMIMLILGLILIFSLIAIVSSIVTEETTIISDKVKEVKDCQQFLWQEEKNTYGACTKEVIESVCDDPPTNSSCHNETREISYTCVNGTEIVERTRKECKQKELVISNLVKLDTKNYECSTEEDGGKVIVICDSRYDGNGDGKCSSGESCMKFVIDGDKVSQYEKNSRDDFTEADKTFFLDRASVEVLK